MEAASEPDDRVMMANDGWLGTVLIPEEGLTSVITIRPSNSQSHHSMTPNWQKTLHNRHGSSASRGNLRLF